MAKTKNIRKPIKSNKIGKKLTFDILMIPYFIIALAVILFGVKLWIYNNELAEIIIEQTYQSVFLDSGQVYVGKLEPMSRSYWRLNDVYYIQQDSLTDSSEQTDVQFKLMPLGSELHEPQNHMILNTDHILYWENLKNDSRIIKAINSQ